MKYITAGSRTIIIARLMMILAIVQQYGAEVFPPEWSAFVLFGVALAMEVMRWITVKPVRGGAGNGYGPEPVEHDYPVDGGRDGRNGFGG
jgi:hypothetical protein